MLFFRNKYHPFVKYTKLQLKQHSTVLQAEKQINTNEKIAGKIEKMTGHVKFNY